MADEITEAVQIIRVAFEGIEVAMKVGSGGLSAVQQTALFIKGMLDHEKTMGKTSMKKLLMKGGDLQVLQFEEKDMKRVDKFAKKYGILYSKLPDINKSDGMVEIVIHSEAVPRANLIIQKLGAGRITNIDDYINGGDEKGIQNLLKFFEKQRGNDKSPTPESEKADRLMDGLIEKVGLYSMDKKSVSVGELQENFSINEEQAKSVIEKLLIIGAIEMSEENDTYRAAMNKEAFLNRLNGYREITDRISAIQSSRNPNLIDITISKTLIKEENDHAVKTRIPGTWGQNVRYLWVKKENAMDIHDGKTILYFLEKDKDYKLYDEDNKVVESKKGEELQKNHYDAVEQTVRKRYEKEKKNRERTAKRIAKEEELKGKVR